MILDALKAYEPRSEQQMLMRWRVGLQFVAIVIIMLIIKPHGLFGRASV